MNIDEKNKPGNFLSAFSEKSRIELLRIGGLKHFNKRDIIFIEGDTGHCFYLLSKGSVQISKNNPDGKEIVIKVIAPGEIFAEVILFEQEHYPATAVSLDHSEIFVFNKTDFMDLLDNRDFRNDFIKTLLRKQRYLADQIKYLTIYDVEDRLFKFLREYFGNENKIEVTLSKKDIAAAIGTTPETLSRLILKLAADGKLHWEGKTISIK